MLTQKHIRRVIEGCLIIAIIGLLCLFYGCAAIDRTGHYVQTVTFKLHVVGDRSQYDYPPARNSNSGPAAHNIGGYAKSGNPPEIWITGYRDKGVRPDDV